MSVGAAPAGTVSAALDDDTIFAQIDVEATWAVTSADENGLLVAAPPGPTGAAGRGIYSTRAVSGRLVTTYTDGTTEDGGPLPPGPAGPASAINATFTVSTDAPSGGSDGDVWFQIL